MEAVGETVLGVSPFEHPDAGLVAALCHAGALGILDLGRDALLAGAALEALSKRAQRGFGVRIPEGVSIEPRSLPAAVRCVVLPAGVDAVPFRPRRVLVQVTSLEEAREAVAVGADGLIAKGCESGGRVGEESSFVLLQRLAGAVSLPIWVQGGVGLHTAAACIAGGAAGVVLDSQLALLRESALPDAVKSAIAAMDGSETVVVGGHRLFTRPDLPVASLGAASPAEVSGRLGGTDLKRFLLPAGQDAAFARPLAQRFRGVAGLVRALREAIPAHLREARDLEVLGPDSALARSHKTRYPIVQGPMTRVSDRAAFAGAVAHAGGLPFLALALMRQEEVRALLAETAARLGERSWGVGILGFVPQALRDEQLAVLEEVRPPFALIAGGRPSQARALEERGTVTYLHVPSPGLLDLFLREGARRFVFEGRECGGHVGPRTSFVLWEAQVERLLSFERPSEISVLFAGGIHDARSAAMVAALAAPLAARGAQVGVLMGTAYLFTEEAVASGAIAPVFQEAALSCDRTVLLDTAPGHSTRCVESDYVRAFREEKRRLEAQGFSPSEVWAALEQLNLGRLRIAAKGVRREGDGLAEVDTAVQRREGMFMIGQVAALRHETCTMGELHGEVSEGSLQRLAALPIPEAPVSARPVDIAIIGIGCTFPGAKDRDAFWANIVRGASSITEVPPERWNPDIYFDPEAQDGTKTNSKWGGFLADLPFDPVSFGIPPRSLAAIEPVQLLSLEIARQALADAGYVDREFDRERTSVIFGAEAGTDLAGAYGFRALYPQYVGELPAALDEALPSLTEDSFPGVLGNVIAGRIANRLDLGGVNYTVDAACASSLAAVDLALKELSAGESDMVLCGGADLHNSINDYLMFTSVHALSPSGKCRTFDTAADGIVLGEGVAVVVLKRLADAERDGDRIYAVLKGLGGASDGKCLGLTAPRQEGQVRALERAYRRAGISPAEVGLVEAHGTGTIVGDRTELATLTEVFGGAGAAPRSCALGSVKSQIGHTKCAAGMAGLIKTALAVHNGVLPPTLHLQKPNPFYDPAKSPFVFHEVSRPWPSERRIAAVSAFGFGGTNFHAVLCSHESGSSPEIALSEWPAELFLFRGSDRAAALRIAERLEGLLGRDESWRLRDLAYSAARAGDGPVQVAVVATDLADLRAKLAAARAGRADAAGVFFAGGERGKVAFLFPGQGSQRPGMLGDLFVAFPALQRLLRLGGRWLDRIFPPAAFTPEERTAQKAALTDTRVAQPALGIADLAMADLLGRLGVRPDLVGGHSYGELVALTVAGALGEEDLLALSEARGECIVAAAGDDPGAMAAISAAPAAVASALGDAREVVLANENAPDQTVIAGPVAALEAALARLQAAGLSGRRLPVACAFHSPVVAAAQHSFGARLASVPVGTPTLPVFSNTTAAPYPSDADAIRARLAEHIALPVRFAREIEAMYEAGARTFVEVGPGRVLTGLVGKVLSGKPHAAIACDGEPGLRQLALALAELSVRGVSIDERPLFEGRGARLLDLAAPASLRPPPTAWLVNGHTARPLSGELPEHAMRPLPAPVGAPAQGGGRDAVILEYLRTVREMVETQREVMLAYLGASGASPEARTETPVAAVAKPVSPAKPKAPAAPARAPAPAPSPPAQGIEPTLIAIVSERTGYPKEMLGLDLDLEADLSIDSIKRIEILGVLGEQLGLGLAGAKDRDAMIEELAMRKTLRGILEWLESKRPAAGPPKAEAPAAPSPSAVPPAISRYRLSVERAPAAVPNGLVVRGRSFAITPDDRGLAAALASLLESKGASPRFLTPGEAAGKVDGLIHLSALAAEPASDPVKRLFELSREAVLGGATWLVGATGLGGRFGRRMHVNGHLPRAGVAGLLKSVAKEWPAVRVCAVDLDPHEEPARLAEQIYAELLAAEPRVEVGYVDGERHVLSTVAEEGAERAPVDLGPDSVVLVTGGARGITAHVAIALAQRYRCRLELVGRSPLPDEEPAELAGAADAPALRRLLAARGLGEPAAIESACARILRARDIRATLAAIRDAGALATYHTVDVRDEQAFGALIDRLYAERGSIDGVIHGAGVIEDKLLRDKTRESFERVFDTKVVGAVTLYRKLRPDVRFVAFFSSISGAFGNRGQVDYAAANDALDKLAWALHGRISGRVVSINWGPWAGAGMISPELQREYARRGIALISPEAGVDLFVNELSRPRGAEPQVILLGADPATLP
jgi:acyl transferase domain-containing protein/NAD(P)H-dependent flavin oxidoreductase YrpB (nitropropane dioxygenase family)